jgi:hypothetical protein
MHQQDHLQRAHKQDEHKENYQSELNHRLASLLLSDFSPEFESAHSHDQFIARISTWRLNTQLPLEPQIPVKARSGILKIAPRISGGNVYWMSTRLVTNSGASGSALGTGLPFPAVPQPEEVHVSQLVRKAPLAVFVPLPEEFRFAWLQTWTDAPVGFQTDPVKSWSARYVTELLLVVGELPPDDGMAPAAGVAPPSIT